MPDDDMTENPEIALKVTAGSTANGGAPTDGIEEHLKRASHSFLEAAEAALSFAAQSVGENDSVSADLTLYLFTLQDEALKIPDWALFPDDVELVRELTDRFAALISTPAFQERLKELQPDGNTPSGDEPSRSEANPKTYDGLETGTEAKAMEIPPVAARSLTINIRIDMR